MRHEFYQTGKGQNRWVPNITIKQLIHSKTTKSLYEQNRRAAKPPANTFTLITREWQAIYPDPRRQKLIRESKTERSPEKIFHTFPQLPSAPRAATSRRFINNFNALQIDFKKSRSANHKQELRTMQPWQWPIKNAARIRDPAICLFIVNWRGVCWTCRLLQNEKTKRRWNSTYNLQSCFRSLLIERSI